MSRADIFDDVGVVDKNFVRRICRIGSEDKGAAFLKKQGMVVFQQTGPYLRPFRIQHGGDGTVCFKSRFPEHDKFFLVALPGAVGKIKTGDVHLESHFFHDFIIVLAGTDSADNFSFSHTISLKNKNIPLCIYLL